CPQGLTLDLRGNRFGPEGAQYLKKAIQAIPCSAARFQLIGCDEVAENILQEIQAVTYSLHGSTLDDYSKFQAAINDFIKLQKVFPEYAARMDIEKIFGDLCANFVENTVRNLPDDYVQYYECLNSALCLFKECSPDLISNIFSSDIKDKLARTLLTLASSYLSEADALVDLTNTNDPSYANVIKHRVRQVMLLSCASSLTSDPDINRHKDMMMNTLLFALDGKKPDFSEAVEIENIDKHPRFKQAMHLIAKDYLEVFSPDDIFSDKEFFDKDCNSSLMRSKKGDFYYRFFSGFDENTSRDDGCVYECKSPSLCFSQSQEAPY
ncbi:MAG: hypothetical protein KAS93_02920, partial [Gammaproteobacteria bacterium]|nr:hypothetical protein [Gammaproteobacteria bacterium]